MKQYEVKTTSQASGHILKCAEYIQNELLNPQAARKFVKDIRTAVKGLNLMPQRNPLTHEEPWRGKGIRNMVVRGYIIYYWIDEKNEVVHVIAVIYEKRNQINQLANINFGE